MLRRHGRWVPALVLVVGLTACGSDSPEVAESDDTGSDETTTTCANDDGCTEFTTDGEQPADGGTEDTDGLCAVLDQELAVAALGEPVAKSEGGEVIPRPNGIYCRASAEDPNTNVEAQVKDVPQSAYDEFVTRIGEQSEPVDSVGEMAILQDLTALGGAGQVLIAYGDGRLVTVFLNAEGDSEDQIPAVIAIAQAVFDS